VCVCELTHTLVCVCVCVRVSAGHVLYCTLAAVAEVLLFDSRVIELLQNKVDFTAAVGCTCHHRDIQQTA
jgi:hypothetical protein